MATIDKLIHEPARLKILTYLASGKKKIVSFNELQNSLSFTSGNLSLQLKKLKTAKYIEIHKTFKDNKPYTTVNLTIQGVNALNDYISSMEDLIKSMKKTI